MRRSFPQEEVEEAAFIAVSSGFLVGVSRCIGGRGGVPKRPLRFSDSLTGPTELGKVAIFTLTIYHSKRMRFKMNRGKRCRGRVQETQARAFTCPH